jgi:hypothetical protein
LFESEFDPAVKWAIRAFDHDALDQPKASISKGLQERQLKTFKANFVVAIGAGIAMTCVMGCAPTTHVTETTTTRQYDTTNPPIIEAPVADASTTTTTQYNNGTVQRTYTQPAPYSSPDQSTTTVTTQGDDGTVQKRTTTTYAAPY